VGFGAKPQYLYGDSAFGDTSRMRRLARTACVAVAAFSAGVLFEPEARAGTMAEELDTVIAIAIGAVVLGFVDVGLSFPEAGYAIGGDRYPKPFSITKIAICAPQALFYDGLTFGLARENRDPEVAVLTALMGGWTGAMSTSGSWGLAADIDAASLYGISWAIGMNTALTTMAVGSLVGGKRGKLAQGIFEMGGTLPTLAVSAVRLTDPTSARPAWGALAGWSGLIFVHGLVTTLRARSSEASEERPPEPPAGAAFAPRVFFSPTVVSDGVRSSPGLSVSGVF